MNDRKIVKHQFLLYFLCAFLLIQPFLDVKLFYENPNIQIFGLTLPTIIRLFGIFVMCICSLKFVKLDREHFFYGVYFTLLFIYFIFHHIIVGADMNVPNTYQYSFFSECFYIIRMVLPYIITYISRHIKLKYEIFIKVILIVSLTIGLIIVISNLLHISVPSYSSGGANNKLNFIEWFFYDLSKFSFESLTSKGWFFMANQISGLTMLLAPFNYYEILRKPSALSISSTLFLSIAMLLLGTRVATYGLLIIILMTLVLAFFFRYIKKEFSFSKKSLSLFLLISVIVGGLFVNSPIQNRVYSYGEVKEPESTEVTDISNENYLLSVYKNYKIQDAYIKDIYPYTYDKEFWLDFFDTYSGEVKNNREMQSIILKHIEKINGNQIKHKLFGFSFSRLTNGGLYLENDFVVQNYTLGIIGTILLLGPWIYYLIKGFICMVLGFNKKFNFLNTIIIMAVCACIGCSLFSGHIMDELIVTLFLGFIIGYFINCYE